MAKSRIFRLTGRNDWENIMTVLSDDADQKRGDITLVKHLPRSQCSVFDIKDISVLVDYSRSPHLHFYMTNLHEKVDLAAAYIESRFPGSKLVEAVPS